MFYVHRREDSPLYLVEPSSHDLVHHRTEVLTRLPSQTANRACRTIMPAVVLQCAGRSSCLLTVTTVQLSSGSRVTLMLATAVVIVQGFCVSVLPGNG